MFSIPGFKGGMFSLCYFAVHLLSLCIVAGDPIYGTVEISNSPSFGGINISTASGTGLFITTPPKIGAVGKQPIPVFTAFHNYPAYTNVTRLELFGAVPVLLVFSMIEVQELDAVQNSFSASFYLQMRWPDDSVCPPGVDPSSCQFDPNIMWTPVLEITNVEGSLSTLVGNPFSVISPPTKYLSELPNAGVNWDGPWVLCDQTYTGTFLVPMDFHDFPYDQQNVILQIESAVYDYTQSVLSTLRQVRFMFPAVTQHLMLPPNFAIAEWSLRSPATFVQSLNNFYPVFNATFSHAVVGVRLVRQPQYYESRILIGVLFLAAMNLTIFGLVVTSTDRMMGTLSVFFALISFLFVANAAIPKLPYETRIDTVLSTSFYFVVISVFVHAILYLVLEIDSDVAVVREVTIDVVSALSPKAAVSSVSNILSSTPAVAPMKFVVRNEKSEVVRTGKMIDEKDVGFFGGFKLRMRMSWLRRADLLFVVGSFLVYLFFVYFKLARPVTQLP